jgi:peptidoglycan/LPS O-acetylase OafA/YrhL
VPYCAVNAGWPKNIARKKTVGGQLVVGFYRLVLSCLVVVSHTAREIYFATGYHLGVIAVISFFLLSGFVMTKLISKYYDNLGAVCRFYLDRAVRILPQYLFYVYFTLAAACFFHIQHRDMTQIPTMKSVVLQSVVFPMNFMCSYGNDCLVQTAWSLGLEAFFYACFPFILIFGLRKPFAAASAVFFLLGYCGVLSPDLWTYRFLPGTLFMFICGSWIADSETRVERLAPIAAIIFALVPLAITYAIPTLDRPFVRSVLVGIAAGIPIVYLLRNGLGRWKRLDQLAGDLSYGVFLNQIVVIAFVTKLNLYQSSQGLLAVETFVLSGALSFLTFNYIEKPFIALRRNFRRPKLTKADTALAS